MKGQTDHIPDNRNEAALRDSKRQIQSCMLMRGKDQIEIVHGDQIYCLRVTRQGKLILTK